MTDVLAAEMPQMLEEHKRIVDALEKLAEAASTEKKAGPARFADKLRLHARKEEEVLYPAAILV